MTRRSWHEAQRYVLSAMGVGILLLMARRRSGWLALAIAGATSLFFRDPERRLDPDPSLVYAAADGVIANIDHSTVDPWIPDDAVVRISTFLSLHNVHVNRSPVAGQITETEEIPGGFAPALFGRAEKNQRKRLAIDGAAGRVVVVQIAGMIARKISCWVSVGDKVKAGERIGLIHFGSRTDVLLPTRRATVVVQVGDRVRAGVTPLARYHHVEGETCASS